MKDHKESIVAKELARIYERDGGVRASVVVDEAKPKDSPLHDSFEWNNGKAGAQYRMIQARKLIRRVKIEFEDAPVVLVNVPSVVTISNPDNEGVYKPPSVIVESVSEYTRALAAALSKLNAAQAAVDHLRNAAGGEDDGGRLARMDIAVSALKTAQEALRH